MYPVTPIPALTDAQRAQGLTKARQRRTTRAALLNQVRTGQLTLEQLFAGVDDTGQDDDRRETIRRTIVRRALLAVHGIGATRADRILAAHNIDPDKRLSRLSVQQRAKLVAAVTEAVNSWR